MSIVTTTEPESAAKPSGQSHEGENQGRGRYIYCIIDRDGPELPGTAEGDSSPLGNPGVTGVGQDHPEVFVTWHQDVGAVVSATACSKHDISRENVLAHQRVMEAAMQRGHTVLPVRFNTIAKDKNGRSAECRIVEHVLATRLDEFSSLLAAMSTRVELGIKGLWTDTNAVFANIVDTNEQIKSLRDNLLAVSQAPTGRRVGNVMTAQIKLGEMVKDSLEAKKLEAEERLTAVLRPLIVDLKKNQPFGDAMFVNLAALLEERCQAEVISALSAFEADACGQVKLKCVGPVPPSNFIELVIKWDD